MGLAQRRGVSLPSWPSRTSPRLRRFLSVARRTKLMCSLVNFWFALDSFPRVHLLPCPLPPLLTLVLWHIDYY